MKLVKDTDQLPKKKHEVSDEKKVRKMVLSIYKEHKKIDYLINNAGIYGPHENQLGEIDVDGWAKTFLTNTIAPIKVTEALLSNIFASSVRKVIFITSKMGSMDDNNSGGSYIYRSSKAALNAAGKSMAVDLAQKGVTVLLLHPGGVRTDMTGPSAPMTPSVSVSGMKKVIESTTVMDSGKFIAFDGKEINW